MGDEGQLLGALTITCAIATIPALVLARRARKAARSVLAVDIDGA